MAKKVKTQIKLQLLAGKLAVTYCLFVIVGNQTWVQMQLPDSSGSELNELSNYKKINSLFVIRKQTTK